MRPAFTIAALAALGSAVISTAASLAETVRFPADFRTEMAHYATVDRADGMTYRLYINAAGLHGWQDMGLLPQGTVLVIEAFLAATDASETPLRDGQGGLLPGAAVPDVHLAEKRAAWPLDGLPCLPRGPKGRGRDPVPRPSGPLRPDGRARLHHFHLRHARDLLRPPRHGVIR